MLFGKIEFADFREISFAQLLENRLGYYRVGRCEPWVAGFLLRLH